VFACLNLGNYSYSTSHRAEWMALICDMFGEITPSFIKFKGMKMFLKFGGKWTELVNYIHWNVTH
jgi:hypothetical protein